MSPRLAKAVEQAARRVGLPLGTLELLAQDSRVAVAFVAAEARGAARDFLDTLDAQALEAALRARSSRVADAAPPTAAFAF